MISPVSDELATFSVLSNTLQRSHIAREAECSLFNDEGWKKLLYLNDLIDALSQINAPAPPAPAYAFNFVLDTPHDNTRK